MARIDRIAEPWGSRTPYGPGETWPTRVDSYLADGLTEDQVDRRVQSATILHSNGDGLDIAVKDGRIVGVQPIFKTAAAQAVRVETTSGAPSSAPTTTGSAPVSGAVPPTRGGEDALAVETVAEGVR